MAARILFPFLFLGQTLTDFTDFIQNAFKFGYNVLFAARNTIIALSPHDRFCIAIFMILCFSTAYNIPIWLEDMCGPDCEAFKWLGTIWIHLFPAQLVRNEPSARTVRQVLRATSHATQAIANAIGWALSLCAFVLVTPFTLLRRLPFCLHRLVALLHWPSSLRFIYVQFDPIALLSSFYWSLAMLAICAAFGVNVTQLAGVVFVGVCFIIGLAMKQPRRKLAQKQEQTQIPVQVHIPMEMLIPMPVQIPTSTYMPVQRRRERRKRR